MDDLSKSYDPKQVEEKWGHFWEEHQFFKANAHSSLPPYCIVIPPPNVTGVLHMGHALVNTLQDILIRWKRMQGFEALWIPGTDHAGIATQTVVERHLKAQTGKRRKDFSREEFLEHVWEWKEKSEARILAQLRKLGCSLDWSRLHFTMDETCSRAVRTIFKRMYDKELIYRGFYLVNWDPASQTALSDDEIEYEERDTFLWHIRYPLKSGQSITIATTRPETMLGDVAVAISPNDPRAAHLTGESVLLPFSDREIPIIADPFVDSAFGTGMVKITPGHDFADYEMAQRHALPMINIMEPDGTLNENGGKFCGMTMEAARKAIVEELKKSNLLEKAEPHRQRVGLSYRSKAIIEPYLSLQWFIRMAPFKQQLIDLVKEKRVKLVPSYWEETYFHWIENLRDWCISRQLWWGHRIPIWINKKDRSRMICYAGEGTPPAIAHEADQWEQETDVLDTWFSSALWPFSTLGWPDPTADLKKFYPTSVLVTGHDILFFWVARMMLMGTFALDEVPFHEVFLHGLIFGKTPGDENSKWEKMSKSKGNVIDPLEVIEDYGTDALRMALTSSVTHARQIDLDKRRFEEYRHFANKIWNGARFILMNLEKPSKIVRELLNLEDRWILSLLNRTILNVTRSLENYTFDKAAIAAYEFFWKDLCSVYLELTKPFLFGKAGTPEMRANKQNILLVLLCNLVRLMHPLAPFITEELFSVLKERFGTLHCDDEPYMAETARALHAAACAIAPYPNVIAQEDMDATIEEEFSVLQEIVYAVRNIRGQLQIPPGEKIPLHISGNNAWLRPHEGCIRTLAQVESIHWGSEGSGPGSFAMVGALKLFVPLSSQQMEKEKKRLEKEREKLEILAQNTARQLDNPELRAKAPAALIEKLEQTLKTTRHQLEEIEKKLLS